MPLLRYFVFVGGALLALLLVCNAVIPTEAPLATVKSGSDLPAIRIQSERKWPERVVIDTSIPTSLPAKVVALEPKGRAAEAPAVASARDAHARMMPPAPTQRAVQASRPADPLTQIAEAAPKPPQPKLLPKRKSARTAHPGRPMMIVAQQPHFGWFDTTW